jgi:hypothetical protein
LWQQLTAKGGVGIAAGAMWWPPASSQKQCGQIQQTPLAAKDDKDEGYNTVSGSNRNNYNDSGG